ncbi:hypothetical protein EJB05_24237 [Eragrostis curvula]|uniref:Knottin scorpion toxin-like domain-containing protein n=1 Tax=Eragrostis curvula TaxID=38414 RepID=A0A5J9V949_9POAL|nr:hypothetical protein EJB05_24237 [Eragrostis curvula]
MRNCHRAALLLAGALLVLSGTVCTATAANEVYRPEYMICNKILFRGTCNNIICDNNCFSRVRGTGRCNRVGCQCTYMCKPPPGQSPQAGGPIGWVAGGH